MTAPNHAPRRIRAALRRLVRQGEGLGGTATRKKAAREWRDHADEWTLEVLGA